MLKSKMSFKLSIYFATALLTFSIIIGIVFMVLFKNHTIELHKTELETRANDIAINLSDFMDGESGKVGGYGAYMRFIDDIAGSDVWIVDSNFNLITGGKRQGAMSRGYSYEELPQNAGKLISEVFTDKTVFSEGFSDVLKELTLTVGVPIHSETGKVIGVVLLHSPVHGTNEATTQGFKILGISMLVALGVAILVSVVFSWSFTKPLDKMRITALKLANGNFKAKTGVKQNDEIGELASTLDVLAVRLDNASQESEKLQQLRCDFVANVSHELKTPVTVMRGSLEALVDKVVTDSEKVEDYHKQMLDEAKFLQRLVGDLLDLSRLQNTDFAMEKSEISICDILEDVKRSATHLAKQKGIEIVLENKCVDFCFLGDYGRIRQMLMIIIDNAIKFSPENSVIELLFSEKQLKIKDYGIGINSEDLPYIFDRFYKSHSQQNKTGTGLGLAIAKQIADRHGIALSVESEEHEGSTFIFKF